ncbi:MAG: fibronectin type III domain-containing protein [Bacteroidetes bacterium]|nr:fibronectin type III domain-containing protein [Bacteroidota bacterium]
MKIITSKIFFLIFSLISISTLGQTSLTSFPENLQLFIRNEKNVCEVKISGNAANSSFDFVSLKLYKNDSLQMEAISSPNDFNFTIPINSELSEYTFELNGIKDQNNILIKKSEKILCGDAILLLGQSNMSAISGIDEFNWSESDKFMRNFDFFDLSDTTVAKWYTGKKPYAQVGAIGNYLVKNLIDSVHIPFLVINQSAGGANIKWLTERNPTNPFDKKYNYGKMLTKLKNSQIIDKIKYMAFLQGEAEAGNWYGDCDEYPEYFDIFIKNIRKDIPGLKKFYEFQINILMVAGIYNYNERASYLREFQRQTKNKYPGFVEIISTVGTDYYDGIHYQTAGYISKAKELSHLILRDFYGKIHIDGIEHPNVQYAYYSEKKDSVILVFQERQKLNYPVTYFFGNHYRYMQNYFYMTMDDSRLKFNQLNTPVVAGTGVNNRIILKLNAPHKFKYLTYLPACFSDIYSANYNGPHLFNQNNLKAFSFYCLSVEDSPPKIDQIPKKPENLVANGVNSSQINISWRDISENEEYFSLESSGDAVNFQEFYKGNNVSTTEKGLPVGKYRYYRVKSCNSNGCSEYSETIKTATFDKINYDCLNYQYDGILKNLRKTIIAKKITSGAIHQISELKLEAGEVIVLNPGFNFSANTGKTFEAIIEGCREK